MLGSNAEERGILALAFGYNSFGAALRAMDAYGDERSAHLVNELRSAWQASGTIPDLSHENRFGFVRLNPTRDDLVMACTGVIDSYDSARESGDRSKLSLRQTVEALFELRAFARLQPSGAAPTQSGESAAPVLQRELNAFPLNAGQVNKLKKGGYLRLRDLKGVPVKTIAGKCGMTERQVAAVDEVLANYLLATVTLHEIAFRASFEASGKEALGESFEAIGTTGEIWLTKYKMLASSAGVKARDWEVYLDAMAGGGEPVLAEVRQFFELLKARAPVGEPDKAWKELADQDHIYWSSSSALWQLKGLVSSPSWIDLLCSETYDFGETYGYLDDDDDF